MKGDESTIIDWFANNWQTIATFIGGGTGGGLIAKKLVDQKQDSEIKSHKEKIEKLEHKIEKLEDDVEELKIGVTSIKHIEQKITSMNDNMDKKMDKLEEGMNTRFATLNAQNESLMREIFEIIKNRS